jgi:acyl dehydratase
MGWQWMPKTKTGRVKSDMTKEIPAEALNLIGVERQRDYVVTKRDIRRFAQAIGDPDPLYYDEAYAQTTRYKSIVAPPLFCQAFAFSDVPPEQLPPDGSPVEADVPLPARRLVGGGSVFDTYIRIRPGDRITVNARIKDIYTRQGKRGRLYFIVHETTFYNQNDELAAKEVTTFIKRI